MNNYKFKDVDVSKNDILTNGATFKTKQKYIMAIKILQYQSFIDSNGQQFIGIPGNYKILNEKGIIQYINQYQFNQRYMPLDVCGFAIKNTKIIKMAVKEKNE